MKLVLAVLVLVVMLCGLAFAGPAQATPPPNGVLNPQADTDNSWTSLNLASPTTTLTRDTGTYRSSPASFKIVGTAANAGVAWHGDADPSAGTNWMIANDPSDTVHVSAYVYGTAGDVVRIGVRERDASGAFLRDSFSNVTIAATNTWQRVDKAVTVGADSYGHRVMVLGNAAMTFYVDDVQSTEGATLWDYYPTTAPSDFLLLTEANLMALPTTGTGWTYLAARKSDFMSQVTTSPTSNAATDCQLRNYENSTRYGQKALAAAIYVARTGDATVKTKVQDCLRQVIGMEDRASTDGTSSDDGILATMRNLPAFVLAADFIRFDGTTTGSRSGWTTTTWNSWLDSILTKTIGTRTRWNTITGTSTDTASNWGAAAMMARTFVELHRSGGTISTGLSNQWHRWMGDVSYGVDFNTTADSDSSWWCTADGSWPAGKVRRPINTDLCASDLDGVIVEDAARGSAYPTLDSSGLSYSNEHAHFISAAALALKHAGVPVQTWSDGVSASATFPLIATQANAHSWYETASIHRELPYQMNWLLGTSYTTSTSLAMGRAVSYVEWLSGAR
jgi:hypothetical protein